MAPGRSRRPPGARVRAREVGATARGSLGGPLQLLASLEGCDRRLASSECTDEGARDVAPSCCSLRLVDMSSSHPRCVHLIARVSVHRSLQAADQAPRLPTLLSCQRPEPNLTLLPLPAAQRLLRRVRQECHGGSSRGRSSGDAVWCCRHLQPPPPAAHSVPGEAACAVRRRRLQRRRL